MRKILLFILLIISVCVKSQVIPKTMLPPVGGTNTVYRIAGGFVVDSIMQFRTFNGVPNINMLNYTAVRKWAAIAFDSTNHLWYGYDPTIDTWSVLGGGGGGSTLFALVGSNTALGDVTGNVATHNLNIINAATLTLGANIYSFASPPPTYSSGGFSILGYNQATGNMELVPSAVSASNGVNTDFGDVELGGSLTKNTSIQTSTFGLTLQSNASAIPLQTSSQNNVAFSATTFTGAYAGGFSAVSGTTNAISTLLNLTNGGNGSVGANNIGGSIDFQNFTTTASTPQTSNRIVSQFSNDTNAIRTSKFYITGVDSSTTDTLLTLAGNGQQTLNRYGRGLFTSGSPAYVLATTSAGQIIETSVPTANVIVDSVTLTFDGFHADTTFNLTRAGFKNLEVQAESEEAGGFIQKFNSTQAILEWQAAILGSFKFYITYYF